MFGFRYGWTQRLKTTINQEVGLSYLLSPEHGLDFMTRFQGTEFGEGKSTMAQRRA